MIVEIGIWMAKIAVTIITVLIVATEIITTGVVKFRDNIPVVKEWMDVKTARLVPILPTRMLVVSFWQAVRIRIVQSVVNTTKVV